MKSFIITAIAAFTGMVANAQTTETREAKQASTLEVKNGIEVILTQGDIPSLKVEAQTTGQLYNVATVYKKGVLKIYLKDAEGIIAPIKVYVTEPNFSHIDASNGAAVKVDGRLENENIEIVLTVGSSFNGEVKTNGELFIKASSGANFRGAVHTNTFHGVTYSGGVIKAVGEAVSAKVYSRGGTIHAGKLLTQATQVTALHGAAIFVHAQERIQADTDAASTITYYGEPATAITGSDTYSIQRDTKKLSLNN